MFAVLHVADFPLQAVLRIERAWRGRAVALLDESPRSPVVVACTLEAERAGVQLGSTPPQAMARCPDIVLRSRNAEAEAEARAGLLAAAFAVSPQVEDTAPGVCTMQVDGIAVADREPVLRAAVVQLAALGLVATAGLAPTPLLALYAARHGAEEWDERSTSNFQRPTSKDGTAEGTFVPGAATAHPDESGLSSRLPSRRDEGVASPAGTPKFAGTALQVGRGVPPSRGRADEPRMSNTQPEPGVEPGTAPQVRPGAVAEASSLYESGSSGAATVHPDESGPSLRLAMRRDEGVTSPAESTDRGVAGLVEPGPGSPTRATTERVRPVQDSMFEVQGSTFDVRRAEEGGSAGRLALPPSHSAEAPASPAANSKPQTPNSELAARLAAPTTVLTAPAAIRAFLHDLPLIVAAPPPETAAVLAGWGIHTFGQLTALTKADISRRLGADGLALWERAAGEVDRPLRLIAPPQDFQAAMDVEEPVETLEPLLFLLRRFIDRLALDLRTAGFVAGGMTLELRLADETRHRREFRLPEPTAREEVLFRVLHTHLETLHTEAEVQGVRLEFHPVRPLNRQQGLFENALRDPHGFAETLARAAEIAGPDRVGTPVVENTHRPDAFRIEPPPQVVPPPPSEPAPSRHGPPLRRYRPAVPAKVELSGQAPAFVWTPGVVGGIRLLAGPWRGSGDWWDAAKAWRREEWDIELESGGVYRLLHTPDGWFLEGEYD